MTLVHTTIAVVNDLMFASRIRGAAALVGVDVTFVRSREEMLQKATSTSRVLLDLQTRWLEPGTDVAALKAAGAEVIAFAPHVDAAVIEAARAAGADRVLARSAFVKLLPDLLQG